MRLTNFIVQDAILPALKTTAADVNPRDPAAVSGVKERVIREMVDSLAAAGGFPDGDLEDITKAVLRREQLGTTGIGKNIAIPHSRHPSVNKLVGTLALAPAGLPFESLDVHHSRGAGDWIKRVEVPEALRRHNRSCKRQLHHDHVSSGQGNN